MSPVPEDATTLAKALRSLDEADAVDGGPADWWRSLARFLAREIRDQQAELESLASATANVATHLGMVGKTEQKRRDYHVARIDALRDIETRLRRMTATELRYEEKN